MNFHGFMVPSLRIGCNRCWTWHSHSEVHWPVITDVHAFSESVPGVPTPNQLKFIY
jgi:hypothetical protein